MVTDFISTINLPCLCGSRRRRHNSITPGSIPQQHLALTWKMSPCTLKFSQIGCDHGSKWNGKKRKMIEDFLGLVSKSNLNRSLLSILWQCGSGRRETWRRRATNDQSGFMHH